MKNNSKYNIETNNPNKLLYSCFFLKVIKFCLPYKSKFSTNIFLIFKIIFLKNNYLNPNILI